MLPLMAQIRENHPFMSARHIYKMLKPESCGRDAFERFCHQQGYKVNQKRNYRRTTNSLGVTRFKNHLETLSIDRCDQAWVSDITYYEIGDQCYYLTFIMDLYSRRILGYSVATRLFTESTTIPALKMAIRSRKGRDLKGLIIHSDGGGQYYCKEFLKLTEGMINSMCDNVYDNPHAERINGTIKNMYLAGYKPKSFEDLKVKLAKAVYMYNSQKPHRSLNGLTPLMFEASVGYYPQNQCYTNKKKKVAKKKNLIINNIYN
jgi:putative transposase